MMHSLSMQSREPRVSSSPSFLSFLGAWDSTPPLSCICLLMYSMQPLLKDNIQNPGSTVNHHNCCVPACVVGLVCRRSYGRLAIRELVAAESSGVLREEPLVLAQQLCGTSARCAGVGGASGCQCLRVWYHGRVGRISRHACAHAGGTTPGTFKLSHGPDLCLDCLAGLVKLAVPPWHFPHSCCRCM